MFNEHSQGHPVMLIAFPVSVRERSGEVMAQD